MGLELYYDLVSEPCRAVYIFLKAAGVPFEPKGVSLIKGDHYKIDYVQINPWKKVPIVVDGGFVLSESSAILRYVAEKYDVAEHLYPRNDVRRQAKIDEFLHWHHLNLRQPMLDILLGMLLNRIGLGEFFPKTPLNEEKLSKAKQDFEAAVNHLADYYLRGQDFIGGEDISVGDLMAVCHIVPLEAVSMQELYESLPKISAYVKRVEEKLQPLFKETGAVNRDLKNQYDKECSKMF